MCVCLCWLVCVCGFADDCFLYVVILSDDIIVNKEENETAAIDELKIEAYIYMCACVCVCVCVCLCVLWQ